MCFLRAFVLFMFQWGPTRFHFNNRSGRSSAHLREPIRIWNGRVLGTSCFIFAFCTRNVVVVVFRVTMWQKVCWTTIFSSETQCKHYYLVKKNKIKKKNRPSTFMKPVRQLDRWDFKSEFSQILHRKLQSELFAVCQSIWGLFSVLWGESGSIYIC